MTLRIVTFFCNSESKLYQEVKDCRPIEMKYWKKILFEHAMKSGHDVIVTEELRPGIKDKKEQ